MITNFKYPKVISAKIQKINKESRLTLSEVSNHILNWADIFIIVNNFLFEEIDNFKDAKDYFINNNDTKCNMEYKDNTVNIANVFYFDFDK